MLSFSPHECFPSRFAPHNPEFSASFRWKLIFFFAEVPCSFDDLMACTEQKILERSKKMYYVLPQYARGHYSNLGFALLGRALGTPSSPPSHSASPLGNPALTFPFPL